MTEKKTEYTVAEVVETSIADGNVFATKSRFEFAQRIAGVFAKSGMTPKAFKDDIGSCMIALELASRLNIPVFMLMQNMYLIPGSGKPGIEAKFLIALFNKTGVFSPLQYIQVGEPNTDSYGYYAQAKHLESGETIKGPEVTYRVAKAEGWYSKSGSKWGTMPELMFRYRAASWFIKLHAPELAMGMMTVDEIRDSEVDTAPAIIIQEDPQNSSIDKKPDFIRIDATVEQDIEHIPNIPEATLPENDNAQDVIRTPKPQFLACPNGSRVHTENCPSNEDRGKCVNIKCEEFMRWSKGEYGWNE